MTSENIRFQVSSPEVAARVLNGLLASSGALNDMLFDIQPIATPGEFQAIRHGVGEIMGRTMHSMLMSIAEQYPDLDSHDLLGRKGEAL